MTGYDWRDLARATRDGDEARREAGRERFAVALVGEPTADGGWLVEATGAEEAKRIVHGTVPRAHECAFGELMVWTVAYFRERHLGGGDFPDTWIVLGEAAVLAGEAGP